VIVFKKRKENTTDLLQSMYWLFTPNTNLSSESRRMKANLYYLKPYVICKNNCMNSK